MAEGFVLLNIGQRGKGRWICPFPNQDDHNIALVRLDRPPYVFNHGSKDRPSKGIEKIQHEGLIGELVLGRIHQVGANAAATNGRKSVAAYVGLRDGMQEGR